MHLWRDYNLDLIVTRFAARFSAYNPIEHLWSPLSKKLNSIRFKSVDGADERPPCAMSGLSDEVHTEKEAKVFDTSLCFNTLTSITMNLCLSSEHYLSYLEMCELEPEKLEVDDSALPSCKGSDLGRCQFCPAFSFLSKTEKKRHMSVFHRHASKRSAKRRKSLQAMQICCVCSETFITFYQLRKHKKITGHVKRRKVFQIQ